MISLITPGLGKLNPQLFSTDPATKEKYFAVVKNLLGDFSSESTNHEVISACTVAESIACAELYLALGGDFFAVCGYSVGQFAALAIAGILDAEAALALTVFRSQLMKKHMPPGYSMVSVIGLDQEILQKQIDDLDLSTRISFCTINSKFNFSVGGHRSALDALLESLQSRSIQAKYLDVEGAWHSSALDVAVPEYNLFLKDLNFRPPLKQFVCNYSGRFENDPEVIKTNLLGHLCKPVLWNQCIATMVAAGTSKFFETGSGDQLKKMLFYMRTKPCLPMGTKMEIKKCVEL